MFTGGIALNRGVSSAVMSFFATAISIAIAIPGIFLDSSIKVSVISLLVLFLCKLVENVGTFDGRMMSGTDIILRAIECIMDIVGTTGCLLYLLSSFDQEGWLVAFRYLFVIPSACHLCFELFRCIVSVINRYRTQNMIRVSKGNMVKYSTKESRG